MSQTSLAQDLFELIDSSLCTEDLITGVLQNLAQNVDNSIRRSGNKSDKVLHLKHAAKAYPAAKTAAQMLLRDAEESGAQHIYLFKPKENTGKWIFDGNKVANKLWGSDWKSSKRFPKYTLVSEGLTVSDFRFPPENPAVWTLKTYGHKSIWDPKPETLSVDGRTKTKQWTLTEERSVYVLKMNSFGLFEVRTPRTNSIRADDTSFQNAWECVLPTLRPSMFEPWCMQAIRRGLYSQREEYDEEPFYRCGPCKFSDEDSSNIICKPAQDEESLGRGAANTAHSLSENPQFALWQLTVRWIGEGIESQHADGLNTIIGGRHSHRLTVTRSTIGRILNHVIDQIRQFE